MDSGAWDLKVAAELRELSAALDRNRDKEQEEKLDNGTRELEVAAKIGKLELDISTKKMDNDKEKPTEQEEELDNGARDLEVAAELSAAMDRDKEKDEDLDNSARELEGAAELRELSAAMDRDREKEKKEEIHNSTRKLNLTANLQDTRSGWRDAQAGRGHGQGQGQGARGGAGRDCQTARGRAG